MSQNTSNLTLVQEAYDSFARGDVEHVLSLMDDEIEWTEMAGGPDGGVYHGPEEVLTGVFQPIGEKWEGFTVTPHRFIDGGDQIVAYGTYSGTSRDADKNFEASFAHIWDVVDGRVVRFEQFADTARLNDSLEA